MASEARTSWSRAILLAAYRHASAASSTGRSASTPRSRARRSRWPRNPATPGSTWSSPPRAYAFFLIGEHDEALAVLDRAIELADGDPTVGAGHRRDCPLAYCYVFKGGILCDHGPARRGTRADRARHEARRRAGRHRDGRLGPHVERVARVLQRRARAGDGARPAGAGYRGADRRLVLPRVVVGLAGPRRSACRGNGGRRSRRSSDRRRSRREHSTAADAEGWHLHRRSRRRHTSGLGDAERAVDLLREAVALLRSRGQAGERRSRTSSSPGSCWPPTASPHARRSSRRWRGRASWRAAPARAASSR